METLEQIALRVWVETAGIVPTCDHYLHFARRLVAQLKELKIVVDYNELAKQEPVGYFSINDYGVLEQTSEGLGTPLYAAPIPTPEDVRDDSFDVDSIHPILCDIWNRVISADEGLEAIDAAMTAAPGEKK